MSSSFGELLKKSWGVLKENSSRWAVYVLLLIVINAVVGVFGYQEAEYVDVTPQDIAAYQAGEIDEQELEYRAMGYWFASFSDDETLAVETQEYVLKPATGSWWVDIVSMIASFIVGVGVLLMSINHVRGNSINILEAIKSVPFMSYVKYLLASIVMAILILLGFIALIVPGIILSLMFAFTLYFVVDKQQGVFDALAQSTRITKGFKWKLFGFVLLTLLLNIAGALALLIGLIITVPLTYLVWAHVYEELLMNQAGDSAQDDSGELDEQDIVLDEVEEGDTTGDKN